MLSVLFSANIPWCSLFLSELPTQPLYPCCLPSLSCQCHKSVWAECSDKLTHLSTFAWAVLLPSELSFGECTQQGQLTGRSLQQEKLLRDRYESKEMCVSVCLYMLTYITWSLLPVRQNLTHLSLELSLLSQNNSLYWIHLVPFQCKLYHFIQFQQ